LDKFLKELIGAGKIQNSKKEVIFGGLNCQKSENPKSNLKKKRKKEEEKGITFLYLVPSSQKCGRIIKYLCFL